MQLYLSRHAGGVVVADTAIFLDLRADRYFALPAATGSFVFNLVQFGHDRADGSRACQTLTDLNIAVPVVSDQEKMPRSQIVVPSVSALETGHSRIALTSGEALLVARCYTYAASLLRTRSLFAVCTRLHRLKLAARQPMALDEVRIAACARSFIAHRRLLPWQPICLRDSVALMLFLSRRSLVASMTFAVQPKPFHAHCWVQTDTMILSDSAFGPASLHPIFQL